MAWIIFACHSGHGGVVNRFLSSKYWMPLARLSYCLYLVSPVIQYNLIASTPHLLNLEISHIVSVSCSTLNLDFSRLLFCFQLHNFLRELSISLVGALALNLLVEQPFSKIAKHLSAGFSCEKQEKTKISQSLEAKTEMTV
jgi:peptidoglycan/LPS O-acetylase OafA/YrhL